LSHQPHNLKLDSYTPVSAADLAVIVSSHDLLQAWNNLNESALRAEGKCRNAQLVNNIQSTAALIAQTEKVISSQNFELMRALNLYDQTLSPVDIAKGFLSGIGNKLTDIAKQATAFTEPEDMNLQHAQARVDALLSKPQKIADAINILWQNPGILSNAFQAELSEARQRLVQSMVGEHPEIVIGSELGTIATSVIVNSINPTNKAKAITDVAEFTVATPMDWHNYATLIGGGLHPPPLKPMRDFSDLMKFNQSQVRGGPSRLIYEPDKSHKIIVDHFPDYGTNYLIKANVDREKYGSGTEMFLSAIKKLHGNGEDISRIKDTWDAGQLGTNWKQFMDARQAGDSTEQAAKHTFTGRMAERIGLTSVNVSKVSAEIEVVNESLQKNYSTLSPVFHRPDWGSNAAWSDYANKWSLSQGRPALTVMPRINTDTTQKSNYSIPDKLLQQVEKLPVTQQESVLKQLYENYFHHADIATAIKKVDDTDIER
jgi:hypothetical protein